MDFYEALSSRRCDHHWPSGLVPACLCCCRFACLGKDDLAGRTTDDQCICAKHASHQVLARCDIPKTGGVQTLARQIHFLKPTGRIHSSEILQSIANSPALSGHTNGTSTSKESASVQVYLDIDSSAWLKARQSFHGQLATDSGKEASDNHQRHVCSSNDIEANGNDAREANHNQDDGHRKNDQTMEYCFHDLDIGRRLENFRTVSPTSRPKPSPAPAILPLP